MYPGQVRTRLSKNRRPGLPCRPFLVGPGQWRFLVLSIGLALDNVFFSLLCAKIKKYFGFGFGSGFEKVFG